MYRSQKDKGSANRIQKDKGSVLRDQNDKHKAFDCRRYRYGIQESDL
jgi:hypothetical protein